MNLAFYIATRYFKAKKSTSIVQIINSITMLGVLVGTMALLIILSIFGGLKNLTFELYSNIQSDILIESSYGKRISFTPEELDKIQQINNVEVISPIVEEKVFLNYKEYDHIAYLKGVPKNYTKVIKIDTTVFVGDYLNKQHPNGLVFGNQVGGALSLPIYDSLNPVDLFIPKPGISQSTNPMNQIINATGYAMGIFSINDDYDQKYIFSSLAYIKDFLNLKANEFTSLEIKTTANSDQDAIKVEILKLFPKKKIIVLKKEEQQSALRKLINTEQLIIYMIFSLVLMITTFNLIGSIVIQKLNKAKDIEVLKQLGLGNLQIRNIFFFNGFLISITGCFIGLSLASIILSIQKQFSIFKMGEFLPYPVSFELKNYIIVLLTVTIVGSFTSYFTVRKLKF